MTEPQGPGDDTTSMGATPVPPSTPSDASGWGVSEPVAAQGGVADSGPSFDSSATTPPAAPSVPSWSEPAIAVPTAPSFDITPAAPAPAPDYSQPAAPAPFAPAPDYSQPATQAWSQPAPPPPPAPAYPQQAYQQPAAPAAPAYPQQAYQPPAAPAAPAYPQQAYQQPAAPPPPAYQQQAYTPPAGYPQQGYPQQGYPQQGYPQQGYPQQPGPAWGQPAQPSQWAVGQPIYQYRASALVGIGVALAGLILFLPGIPVTLFGILTVAVATTLRQYTPTDPQYDTLKTALTVIPFGFLIGGILMLVSGVGVWAHKQWARFIGILISLLVFLAFLAVGVWLNGQHGLAQFTNSEGNTVTIKLPGFEGALIPLVIWGFVVVVLVLGGSYFRRVRVN